MDSSPLKRSSTLTPESSKQSLGLSGGYDRKQLAPPPKFKKANDSLRSIFSIDGYESEGSSPESKHRGKFLLEHEKEESWKGKGKSTELRSNNTTSSNDHGTKEDEDNSATAAAVLSKNVNGSPGSSRKRGSSLSRHNAIPMDILQTRVPPSDSPSFSSSPSSLSESSSSRPSTPIHNRSNSVSSMDSVGSMDSLVHKPKKKSLLSGIFDKPSPKKSQEPPVLKVAEKSMRLFSQPSVNDMPDKRLYSRKPFQRLESYQTVKDKKYKAVLERQQQRVLTELPRMVELQLIEEAYPIILHMCREYIKNLGEKHEITQIAIERLNLMAKHLQRQCEYPLEDPY